jgi:hypothetical protein
VLWSIKPCPRYYNVVDMSQLFQLSTKGEKLVISTSN